MKIRYTKDKNSNNVEVSQGCSIEEFAYLDEIIKLSGIRTSNGDTLEISWDLELSLYVNKKLIDKKPLKFSFFKAFKKERLIRYARLTTRGDKGKIRIYERLPSIRPLPQNMEYSLEKAKEIAREREELRKKKKFKEADKLRKELEEGGWKIRDEKGSPVIYHKDINYKLFKL